MSGTTLAGIVDRLDAAGIAATVTGDPQIAVDDVVQDHRDLRPGGLFCCVVGARFDGHDLAADAVAAGAVALLVERHVDVDVPQITVGSVRAAVGPVAALVHGDPSQKLCCVGITGTNGKTTTAALLGGILRAAGRTVEVIGTLTGARTTPEASELQRTLARFRDTGVDTVVMEVSSHALALHRVDGLRFELAVFTNLSRDHLDFHGTMEEYFRAKALLFEPSLSDRGVVATDDPYGSLLLDAAAIPTTGFATADAEPVRSLAPIECTWHGGAVSMALAGRFNVANAVAAASAAAALGVDDATVRAGLEAAEPVPGRFELVSGDADVAVVVDFAHTPDGIAKVVAAARDLAGPHRVLLVFGAGGDRDRTKRPLMGAAAGAADRIVITNDNPRSEPPGEIAAQVLAGVPHPDRVTVELDRRRAIGLAFEAAGPGDVVVIAGKGHETTQTIGDDVTPFDDREVARDLLDSQGCRS